MSDLDPWLVSAIGTAVTAGLLSLGPELLQLADLMLRPVQATDNARFVRRARQRLEEVDPLVIGITGSYGKTTTKHCIAQVANLVGPTYPTPASFNSFLGVVRGINEGLKSRHQTFIAEMGAYRRGDVAEICELVHPRIGVLTAIGPAHLERFGSLDVTEDAKSELAEALPADGVLITRADDERCRRVAERTRVRTRFFSPDPHTESEVWAEQQRSEQGRTRFVLCRRQDEIERREIRARLLGKHNVANLLAAAVVGFELGLGIDQIARALGRVSSPEHRLAPIVNQAAGVVVIDDAYNSNPEGARSALDVLAAHPAERRILVTPGMVELGSAEEEENRRLGALAADVCDLIILVGPEQTQPIQNGLADAGFPEERTKIVLDTSVAQSLLAEISRPGDVILFENDLPDLYQRAPSEQTDASFARA